jgi:hypothetical protein
MCSMAPRLRRSKATLRTLLALAAGCAMCALLSGCGGAGASSTGTAATSTRTGTVSVAGSQGGSTADVGASAPSRAQALAFAHAVNLTAGDVPETSVQTRRSRGSDATERREYAACGRGLEGPKIAKASSPKLTRGRELEVEQFSSTVEVMRSERTVASEFSLVTSPALRKCFAHVLARNLDDKAIGEARWGRVSVSRLAVHAPGATESAGLRIMVVLDVPFSEITVPVYFDVLGFAIGRVEVGVSAVSATQPVPAATEQELVSLLLARAKSTPL